MSIDEINALRGLASKNQDSLSRYCGDILRTHILEQTYSDTDKRFNFEKRIQTLFNRGAEQLTSILRANEDLLARSGVYSSACWEILKQPISFDDRTKILSVSSRRLREPFNDALRTSADKSLITESETKHSEKEENIKSEPKSFDFKFGHKKPENKINEDAESKDGG